MGGNASWCLRIVGIRISTGKNPRLYQQTSEEVAALGNGDAFWEMGYPRITRPGKRLQFANLKIAIYMFIYPWNTVISDSYVSLPEGIGFDGSDNLLSQQKMPSIGFESGKKNTSPIFTNQDYNIL